MPGAAGIKQSVVDAVMQHVPWALVATAGDFTVAERDAIKERWEGEIGDDGDRVLFTTCHRVELYGIGPIPTSGATVYEAVTAVEHLLRVAAGVESAVTGEDEVLHQVRQAIASARAARRIDGSLIRLFETAIATGRRARTRRHTEGPSLADRAVDWLSARASLSGQPVLVMGAGHMGSLLSRAFNKRQAQVTIASRTRARADRLARARNARAVDMEEAAALAPTTAAVAVALAGPWDGVAGLPLTADLSSPPAVPAAEQARLGGDFLSIDDLYDRGPTGPSAYMEVARVVVEGGTNEYLRWLERRPPRHR